MSTVPDAILFELLFAISTTVALCTQKRDAIQQKDKKKNVNKEKLLSTFGCVFGGLLQIWKLHAIVKGNREQSRPWQK